MRRGAGAALLLASLAPGLVNASPAAACTCGGPSPADVRFAGTAASSTPDREGERSSSPADPVTWHFEVEHAGRAPSHVDIRSTRDDSACGYEFHVGHRYVVEAQRLADGSLFASICSGTHRHGTPVAVTADGDGAIVAASDGGIEWWDRATPRGSAAALPPAAPITDIAGAPGGGYWLLGADAGVFSFGAPFRGSGAGVARTTATAIVPRPGGYGVVLDDGVVMWFGATDIGRAHPRPGTRIVDGVATPTGQGAWLVADDGGVFTLGDAPFRGSAAGTSLTAPAVGIARIGTGYVVALADGRLLGFGPGIPAEAMGPSSAVVAVASATGGVLVLTGDRSVVRVVLHDSASLDSDERNEGGE